MSGWICILSRHGDPNPRGSFEGLVAHTSAFSVLVVSKIYPKPIADVADGLDSVGVVTQLATDERDMLIERAGVAVKRNTPKAVQQPIPLQHFAATLVKKLQQFIFPQRKRF